MYVFYMFVIIMSTYRQFRQLFRQTNKFAKNILNTNSVYLKASADIQISTFMSKMKG